MPQMPMRSRHCSLAKCPALLRAAVSSYAFFYQVLEPNTCIVICMEFSRAREHRFTTGYLRIINERVQDSDVIRPRPNVHLTASQRLEGMRKKAVEKIELLKLSIFTNDFIMDAKSTDR